MGPDLAEARRDGPGRPRALPSLALWAGLLVCVLKGFSSHLDLWRLLSHHQLWFYPRFPVTDQAVYDSLEREGTLSLERLFGHFSAILKERLAPYALSDLAPFASEVLALDETTLDAVARRLPALRALPKGDKKLLPGKLAGLFDLRRQQWVRLEHVANPDQNEKVLARAMVEGLPKGSLILADLGYFGFAWLDHLTESGYYWISRMRANTSYELLHVYYQSDTTFDGLVYLGAHRADRAAYAVRLVSFQVAGTSYSYITNQIDPKVLPLGEIAALYARRWDIEMAFNLIKTHLGLHLLMSSKSALILQQIYAVLIISQILQSLRMEVAGRAGVDPFDVSMELMIRWMPHYAYEGQDPVAGFVAEGRAMRFIRPSRRTLIKAPTIHAEEVQPAPEGLVVQREPRYAHKIGRT
jgi:hypothetical protein